MIKLTRWRKGSRDPERLEFPTFKEAKAASFGFKTTLIRCDSCDAAVINGHFCHETGCPEAWRDHMVACRDCGMDFQPTCKGQARCDDCAEALLEDCLHPVLEAELEEYQKKE